MKSCDLGFLETFPLQNRRAGRRIDRMGNEGRLGGDVQIWEQVNRKNKFNKS